MADIIVQKIKLLDIITELGHPRITCDRRTIYGDIDAMQSNGYSIMNRRRGHSAWLRSAIKNEV